MNDQTTLTLDDVFGTSRDIPKTYVVRDQVDGWFVEAITRDKHIVIHGSSKQGKTCLRKYNLKSHEFIAVQCTRETSKAKLYEMVLKKVGIAMSVTETDAISSATTSGGAGAIEGTVPWLAKAKAKIWLNKTRVGKKSSKREDFEIDLSDANDIARVLAEAQFNHFIIIEDFHYLHEDVQRSLAIDLKVFHEISRLVFIIIGVWLETNRLIMYNGDLTGRLATIDVDKWSLANLETVINKGEGLLNFKFSSDARHALLAGSQANVGLLQEVCNRVCQLEGVHRTLPQLRQIGTGAMVELQYASIAEAQASRYINFLTLFAEGLNETTLHIYRWIAYVVVTAAPNELRQGLRKNWIFKRIAQEHPSGATLQQNNVSQALERVGKVQYRHKLQPLIFDYANGRLRVVDANFILFVGTQDQSTLLEAIGLPHLNQTPAPRNREG